MSPLFGSGDDPGAAERSADERERARLEREARRGAREGRPAPGPAAQAEPAAAPEPAPAPPVAPEPAGVVEPPPIASGPDQVPAAPEDGFAWDAGPEPVRASRAAPREPEAEPDPDLPPRTVRVLRHDDDAPSGVRRVPASALASAAGAEAAPRFGAPPGQTGGRSSRPRRRRGVGRRVAAFVVLLILAAVAYGYNAVYEPFKGDPGRQVTVRVPTGAGASEIGDLLAAKGVVDSGTIFALRARLEGKRDALRDGPHVLREDMTYKAALAALTAAPKAAPTISVTIPEGLASYDIPAVVRKAGVQGSYARALKSFKPQRYGAPKGVRTLEGLLFPATYQLKAGASARSLVRAQLAAFRTNMAKISLKRARRAGLSRYDVVIIASMIEREAAVAKDRRLISAVIYNRLKQRTPLGIDASTRYELRDFSKPLTQSQLAKDTPFNTRINVGLTPTPIGNPGLASLKAAADPAKVDYTYYVVKACGNGAHAFSSSQAQFDRDVAAYERKRRELGGKSPITCK